MGGLLCCCVRNLCCDGDCFEPRDNWQIDAECRPGEIGAGWLYKRGKGSAVWGKRYFVLTDNKMIYYTDPDRLVARGEIIVAGASAKVSSTRSSQRKQYYFTINHPECGLREFYAKSSSRRTQWMDKINDLSSKLMVHSVYGKLLKQGGMNKNIWQERWCLCTGRYIDYFENPTDNQSKGSIDLINANLREFSLKDQKYCFEIVANNSTKKGLKKYIFASLDEFNYNKWITLIKKITTQNSPLNEFNNDSITNESFSSDDGTVNPIQRSQSNSFAVASTSTSFWSKTTFSKDNSDEIVDTNINSRTLSKDSNSSNLSNWSETPNTKSETVKTTSTSTKQSSTQAVTQTQNNFPSSAQQTQVSTQPQISKSNVSLAMRTLIQQKEKPGFKEGYLEKLSPARFKGYQRRYFVLKDPGIILYYATESEAKSDLNPKGDIQISDILPGSQGVEVTKKNEIVLRLLSRSFTLRANSKEDADSWAQLIKSWVIYKSEE